MTVFLEILGLLLQVFLIFFKIWIKGSSEEKKRLKERLDTLSFLLKKASKDKSETINEADYISNLKWEQQQRFDIYKNEVLAVLNAGGGLDVLKTLTILGLSERLLIRIDSVTLVLLKDTTNEAKSIMIAKELAEF